MPHFDDAAISRFEDVLRKDPGSQAFAALAEAYRQQGRLEEAERIVARGLQKHPHFAGGLLTWGKIQVDKGLTRDAIETFKKALHASPENLLALQLLGEAHLENKQGKEALSAFKRLLFLNPRSEKAQKIVAKLETLTADEFSEETFAMTKLKPLEDLPQKIPPPQKVEASELSKGLVRMLSLIDAFIVRHDLHRASQLLDETRVEFGEHPEITQRQLALQRRRTSQLAQQNEVPEPLAPLLAREDMIRRKKIAKLKQILRRIDEIQAPPLPLD